MSDTDSKRVKDPRRAPADGARAHGVDPARRRQLQELNRSDVKPILEALRQMIRRSELSQRQVEEAAGFSRGYLSQLLAQNLDLKVWHLLKILEIFEEHPGDFFHRLRPQERPPLDALADFAERSSTRGDELVASFDRFYRVGLDSLAALRQRLERMEGAVEQLEERGLIDSPSSD